MKYEYFVVGKSVAQPPFRYSIGVPKDRVFVQTSKNAPALNPR